MEPRRRRFGRGAIAASTAIAATLLGLGATPARAQGADATGGDPFGSFQWPDLKREFFGAAPAVFDPRVKLRGPRFAEDPMNVPISVAVEGLDDVEVITVIVDRNPIRKVLEYFPVDALPRVSFRFKLEQASPVRAAARTRDGVWHVGGIVVDSSGGGCTAAGETRRDGSWARSLGEVEARVFRYGSAANDPAGAAVSVPPSATPAPLAVAAGAGARLRLRVMHPMDTGLVGGIPAFYVNRLALRDAGGRDLLRLQTYEPVSENPVFSFDFTTPPSGTLRLVGTDNNGNRIERTIE